MQKIISLFQRNYDGDRLVRDEVVPGAEWVLAGEGRPTHKFDGTCCLFSDGKWWKRYEVKKGKIPPPNFSPASPVDPVTGKQQGWVEVDPTLPENRWHVEAVLDGYDLSGREFMDGTYELCGPKIQGNPERMTAHFMVRHGSVELPDAPRTFAALRDYLSKADIEGIVWHHPDGRMVKIKTRDFGLKRSAPQEA